MDRIGLKWTPNPKQAIALSCPAFELFYGGAKGGGKTDFLLMDFYQGAMEYGEGYDGILFRMSYPELEEVIKRSKALFNNDATYHASSKMWTFRNGATLKLRFIETENDTDQYQGHQYCWIGWDELANYINDHSYTEMMSCLRSPSGFPCTVRGTGNPGKRGHQWCKARFIDPATPYTIHGEQGMGRVFIPATLDDNTHLRVNDPMYERRLENLPAHLYKAFRYGDWDSYEGAYFDTWDSEIHVVDPFTIPPFWYRFTSLDWGYAKPYSIGFWAVRPSGGLYRYHEFYGAVPGKPNVGVRQTADLVAQKAWNYASSNGIIDMVADPSAWGQHGQVSGAVITEFQKYFTCHKGNNDRLLGLEKIQQLLVTNDEHGVPFLTVSSTCKDFIRTFPALMPDKNNPEDIDTKQEDHVYDDTRYAVMSPLTQMPLLGEWEPAETDDILRR